MNKKNSIAAFMGLVALSALVALATAQTPTQQTPQNPPSTGSAVDPEARAAMRRSSTTSGAERVFFQKLCVAGELATLMPAWNTGKVPEFDSKWTTTQFAAKLGRALTASEKTMLESVNTLPYQVKSVATLVGKPLSGIVPGTQVFSVTGFSSVGRVSDAFLDVDALPDIQYNAN